ncbi:hypothetical protein D3C86_2096820 [compost metagenome]
MPWMTFEAAKMATTIRASFQSTVKATTTAGIAPRVEPTSGMISMNPAVAASTQA